MLGAFLESPKHLEVKKTNIPEPKDGEVRIKLQMIGVCGSDVHLFQGHRLLAKPDIIGHEGIGVIDKIGNNVKGRKLGERVVIEPNIPCKNCQYCMSGRGNICINKRIVGVNEVGCFSEYIVLPEAFCWHIPENISDLDAVTIEPTAVGYHALFASKAKPGDTIAVFGLGAIGLLLTHVALKLGYKVLVLELDADKMNMAVSIGAINSNVQGETQELREDALAKLWIEQNVVAIFECAGSHHTASLAAAAAPRGSEIVLVGLSGNLATFRPFKIAREGISIIPSMIYDHPFDFQRVIQLIASKVINPGFVISRYMDLKDIQLALEIASEGKDSKIVITV